MISRTLVAHLQNRKSILVEGSEVAINLLVESLSLDPDVVAISVYQHPAPRREESSVEMKLLRTLNTKQLQDIRDDL